MVVHRFRERAEDDAGLGEFGLEGGGDRDRIEHRVDRDARALDAGQNFLLDKRNAELGVGLQKFGIDFVERLRRRARLRRGEIIEVLEVDLRIFDPRPGRLSIVSQRR